MSATRFGGTWEGVVLLVASQTVATGSGQTDRGWPIGLSLLH